MGLHKLEQALFMEAATTTSDPGLDVSKQQRPPPLIAGAAATTTTALPPTLTACGLPRSSYGRQQSSATLLGFSPSQISAAAIFITRKAPPFKEEEDVWCMPIIIMYLSVCLSSACLPGLTSFSSSCNLPHSLWMWSYWWLPPLGCCCPPPPLTSLLEVASKAAAEVAARASAVGVLAGSAMGCDLTSGLQSLPPILIRHYMVSQALMYVWKVCVRGRRQHRGITGDHLLPGGGGRGRSPPYIRVYIPLSDLDLLPKALPTYYRGL